MNIEKLSLQLQALGLLSKEQATIPKHFLKKEKWIKFWLGCTYKERDGSLPFIFLPFVFLSVFVGMAVRGAGLSNHAADLSTCAFMLGGPLLTWLWGQWAGERNILEQQERIAQIFYSTEGIRQLKRFLQDNPHLCSDTDYKWELESCEAFYKMNNLFLFTTKLFEFFEKISVAQNAMLAEQAKKPQMVPSPSIKVEKEVAAIELVDYPVAIERQQGLPASKENTQYLYQK